MLAKPAGYHRVLFGALSVCLPDSDLRSSTGPEFFSFLLLLMVTDTTSLPSALFKRMVPMFPCKRSHGEFSDVPKSRLQRCHLLRIKCKMVTFCDM